jgi:hypothetical protein
LTQLVGGFISEKGYNVADLVDGQRYYIKPDLKKGDVKKEINKTSSEINELILKLGVKDLKSVDYNEELKQSQNKSVEPQVVQSSSKRGYRYKVYEKE